MEITTGLMSFALLAGLIIGLIKPNLILKKSKKYTRLKIFGIFLLGMMATSSLSEAFKSNEEKAIDSIETAKDYMKKKDYQSVVDELKGIDKDNPHYAEAQTIYLIADSINSMTPDEKQIALDEENKVNLKKELESNLGIIDDTDFTKLRGSIHLLEGELSQFAIWGRLVEEGEASKDPEINKLAGQLRTKLTRIQVREFPIIRKEYAKIVANRMWEEDIEVTSSGTGNRQITFIGGVFAANKSKKKFQEDINNLMFEFRFNRVNYKWHKREQEYTYYTVYKGKDSDLFSFEK